MNEDTPRTPIVIYEGAGKDVEVRLDSEQGTLWLTQRQMADLFEVKPQNITMHLGNIYAEALVSQRYSNKISWLGSVCESEAGAVCVSN